MHTLAFAENIFFLVLVALVGLVRWILQAAENRKNEEAIRRRRPANAPVPRAPAQTEEERVRRFMEALGVPTSTPPPRRERRQVTPKTPRASKQKNIRPIDPFPAPRTTVWPPEAPVVVVPPPVVVVSPPPIPSVTPPGIAPEKRAAPIFEVQAVRGATEEHIQTAAITESAGFVRQKVVEPSQSWAARLGSMGGLRDAIVLREIFGPPRSMQPFNNPTIV